MSYSSRYNRQENLESFGLGKQYKLLNSRVLVVGIGGLGIPVAQYLNAMGVGVLGLVENDIVELHNLQRQVLFTEADIGQSKLNVALERLKLQNSETEFKAYPEFLTTENALKIIAEYDIVVDATDNFATRYLINDACVILDKPFIYGALHAFEGQVSVFNHENGPTYRCLFPEIPKADEIPNCNENGVLGVLPSIIGSLQALEVVKVLTGIGEVLSGKLLVYDGLSQTTRKIGFSRNPQNLKITALEQDYGFSSCVNVPTITSENFLSLKEAVQLIDVRTIEEFEKDHLENALNIPISEFSQKLDALNFDKPIYVMCQSGKRSALAVESLLEQHPSTKVFSISGGMNKIAEICH
ncbi:HesA/MoeB/ThiF family protein [uncultured Croceitalea sp.]|uniref:HesA/MoeB/ThiF family protein n=1 Tax=uncultured Croceitalea sp. TaxID=1798908 RepID=UPI0033064388